MARIPDIDDVELARRLDLITPLARDENGELRRIEPVDPRRVAFTWEPVFGEAVEGGEVVGEINTLHSFGAPSLFKPSLAEVLAQIPVELLPRVRAFELDLSSVTVHGDHHRARVVLYGAETSIDAGPRSRLSGLAS